MQVFLPEQGLSNSLAEASTEKRNIVEEIQDLLKTAEAAVENGKESLQDVQMKAVVESTTKSHTPFPGISQLLPHLFLCGAGVAMPQILDQLAVSFVINVAPELPDTPLSGHTNPLYLRIEAMDRPDVDLAAHFDEVADMIEQVQQHGGKALVHCVAGVSRSASLCLAYLMKHAGMSLREAYHHVKAIRPQIRPNSGFFQQLRRYEEQLRGGESSVRMVFYESLNKEIPDVYEPEYKAMEEFYQRQRSALRRRQLAKTAPATKPAAQSQSPSASQSQPQPV